LRPHVKLAVGKITCPSMSPRGPPMLIIAYGLFRFGFVAQV
jgi:hypothetical protein